eukprot:TRINITY_DN14321_c0_g1_i1.p1 TRINITY_DN14321_c0_g1~~TRINITY_DN14321_c0_g1_i1.p1  ORF type:complete len:169 (+),score=16.97 TRINITY_DN14321_c0_g1_i1:43-549(+)
MSDKVAITGAILCSGCCVLQLMLNFMAFGCAGLSVVEPVRMYFVPITMASAMYLFATGKGSLVTRVVKVVFIMALALSPELLNVYNDNQSQQVAESRPSYEFTVPDMGCEACRYSVISSLKAIDSVTSVEVDLTDKQVKIWSDSSTDLWPTIKHELQQAGFEPENDLL